MKPIAKNIKESVKQLLKNGKSTRYIAQELKISQSTIQRIKAKCKFPISVNVGGRTKKLSDREVRKIIHYLRSSEASSASEAAALLRRDTGTSVSKWTVRRALHKAKMRAFEKKKKPLLTKKNIKAREKFAKQYINWAEDDWMRVIWSDETKINRYSTDGRKWNWKKEGEPLQAKDFIQTVKHGGGNIKLWGCLTAYGVGPIHKIEGNMNGKMYQNILKTHLLETVDNMPYPVNEVIFQHDNDPKHTSKIVKNWLNKQEFQVLPWPSQSPDVNPIENLWAYFKSMLLNEYKAPPSNLNILWERVQEQWYQIPPEYCEKLVKSVENRLYAVKKAKGLWTKY